MTIVGRVVGLWRYPVKSMGAERLDAADVSWHGLAGDRRWAFVRSGMERSGFPWLTIRENPSLWHYAPELTDPAAPDTCVTLVHAPSGETFDVADPALAESLGTGVRVIKQDRGVFDALPLSLISTATVRTIGDSIGASLDARRFRPNVLVETSSGEPFAEDAWVGATLTIGGVAMRVDRRDKRCVMVNVDPDTTQKDPRVLRAIAQDRQACLGVYGSVVTPGRVALGDSITTAAP